MSSLLDLYSRSIVEADTLGTSRTRPYSCEELILASVETQMQCWSQMQSQATSVVSVEKAKKDTRTERWSKENRVILPLKT